MSVAISLHSRALVPPCPRARLPSGSPHPVLPPRPKNKKKNTTVGWDGGWWYQVHVSGRQRPSPPPFPSSTPPTHHWKPQRFGSPSGSALPCRWHEAKEGVLGGTRQSDGYRCPPLNPHPQHHGRRLLLVWPYHNAPHESYILLLRRAPYRGYYLQASQPSLPARVLNVRVANVHNPPLRQPAAPHHIYMCTTLP